MHREVKEIVREHMARVERGPKPRTVGAPVHTFSIRTPWGPFLLPALPSLRSLGATSDPDHPLIYGSIHVTKLSENSVSVIKQLSLGFLSSLLPLLFNPRAGPLQT